MNKNNILDYQKAFLNIYGEYLNLFEEVISKVDLDEVIKRNHLTPKEDISLKYWFAKFLTLRANLWEIVDEIESSFDSDIKQIKTNKDWELFIIGYASACLLVTMSRRMIDEVAFSKLIKNKFNEPAVEYNLGKKEFAKVYKELTNPMNALLLKDVRNLVRKNLNKVTSQIKTSKEILELVHKLEKSINIGYFEYAIYWLRYRFFSFKRRVYSARKLTMFKALELSGKVISEINLNKTKRVTPKIIEQVKNIVKAGDIIVSRHDLTLTNYFIPGFWPHCALYFGDLESCENLGVKLDENAQKLLSSKNPSSENGKFKIDILEALKTGVKLKPLKEMLKVDNFIILRPKLNNNEIKQALEQVMPHIGKDYSFDFDFARSDKLVCSEVIYRAFDGIGGIKFNLIERAGRLTFSAEDLLDMALAKNDFEPIAIFGTKDSKTQIITDKALLKDLVVKSYK